MGKHRVLVVDDSAVMRRLVREGVSLDPAVEVVGTAANGAAALQLISQLKPDLVTLDIEMPEMNGLEALAEIRRRGLRLPVIMFSTLTERGAVATLDALSLGADDYVTKPASTGNAAGALELICGELVPRIKALCSHTVAPAPVTSVGASQLRPKGGGERRRVDVVAIGSSTGGPNALTAVLSSMPADVAVPLLIVQHMPPVFTRFLAERLAAKCALAVREAADGATLAPGTAWIARGDYHLTLLREGTQVRVVMTQEPPENSCRPAVDVMFRSVADVYGGNSLAVVLTGMGQDGLRGARQLHGLGAQIVVQDEASSVVWGMPGFIARAGIADAVLPVGQIAPEILRRVAGMRAEASRFAGAQR
jgi:two-component system chemotaxis response regulator CheB